LIAEIDGVLVGYCYAVQHRQRPAYSWSCESSVYVAEGQRKRGVGRALYEHLFKVLRLQGFRNVLAVLTLPNTPSVRLHESVGFQRIGLINHAGFKHGEWRDVLWMSKDLYPPDKRDQPDRPVDRPTPFRDVMDSQALKSIL
jgi:phosphinothricin acetyltransferase